MEKTIKTRILLPIGTAEELQSKYEVKQLSAGELLVVKTGDNDFMLSAGLGTGISGKLKVNLEELSDYFKKSETSSASEIQTALDGKQPTGDYALTS